MRHTPETLCGMTGRFFPSCVLVALVWAGTAHARWFSKGGTVIGAHPVLFSPLMVTRSAAGQMVEVAILQNGGSVLLIDGEVQSCSADEYIYHETLVHPAMALQRVLLRHKADGVRVFVGGGGEGATLREVLRHPGVRRVIMVDFDELVVESSKRFLPSFHRGSFDDPRVTVIIAEATEYIRTYDGPPFDVAVLDFTDFGSAPALLYSQASLRFSSSVASALADVSTGPSFSLANLVS